MWSGYDVVTHNWGADGDLGSFKSLDRARDVAEGHIEQYHGNPEIDYEPVSIYRVVRVRLFGWSVEATRHVMNVG